LYQQSDSLLNEEFSKLIALSKPSDSYYVHKGLPTEVERLRAAQRAWITYRDKSCEYESPLSPPGVQGGSSEGEGRYLCLTEFTDARLRQLQHYVWCETNGPC
jgi:uncharacterized protein YecT (DUF1311 family)